MAQTAVEWFADKIDDLISDELRERVELLKNEAKQMEKEYHEDTWLDSAASYYGYDYIGKKQTFDQYYTQTYTTRLQNETN